MEFKAVHLGHREQAPWEDINHVRLKTGAVADTVAGQRVLDHIRAHADGQGIAAITAIQAGYPPRRADLGPDTAMQRDLRHLANQREAGISNENKGLLELGWME